MRNVIVACFDVYYYENYAKACCIVFEGCGEKMLNEYSEIIEGVNEYIPGQFYKRELPCILKVLERVTEKLDIIITDSFVWVNEGKKGLGAHLYESLEGKIPIIGVAKTFFKDSKDYIEIYRGESNKPLYVTSIGIDVEESAEFIKNLKGKYRMPDVLKHVDRLSRE